MSQRVVLFDFDGVLFRNHVAQQHVADMSARYCGRYIRCDPRFIKSWNQSNYKRYGHTAKMLEAFGYPASMEEYNHLVFHEWMDYDYIRTMLTTADFDNSTDVLYSVNRLNRNGIECGIMTNGTRAWIDNISELLLLDDVFDPELVFTNDSGLYTKPQPQAYERVDAALPDTSKTLVEDTQANLDPLNKKMGWDGVLVQSADKLTDLLAGHRLLGG